MTRQFERNRYEVSLSFSVSPNFLNKYDLIKEYERFFGKKINEYERKSAGMAEKELHYLSEYTRLLDTWEYQLSLTHGY